MKAFKQIIFGFLGFLALLFIFRSFFCQYFCPQAPCYVPNPSIEFNVAGGDFGLTAHSVPGATSVSIDVFGHDGTLASSGSAAIDSQKIISVPTTPRPLQVVFAYRSADSTVVARDSFLIDDRQNGGTPIIEIVLGVHQGSQQSCPSMTNGVTVTAVTPVVSQFNWTPGKQYKITINHGSTEVIMLKTVLNGTSGCYKAVLWQNDEYACLTPSVFTPISSTEAQVTTGSGDVKITGLDACNGGTKREFSIKSSTPGATITVTSD